MSELNPAMQAAPVEAPSPLAAAREAVTGFAGRIAGGIRSGYEVIQEAPLTYKLLVGTGLATLAIGGKAEAASINPDSVALTGNVPGLMGEQSLPTNQEGIGPSSIPWAVERRPYGAQASDTTDPNLEQECVQAGTAAPQVLQWPVMKHAGIRPSQYTVGIKYAQHHPPETLLGDFEYPALEPPLTSADCAPDYLRVIGGKFFMEKADVRGNPGDPIKKPKDWTDLTYQWGALGGRLTDPNTNKLVESDQGGVNSIGYLVETLAPSFFNQCINGKFRKVDYVAKDVVRAVETKQKVGEAYHIYKAKIQGNCEAAAKSARMAARYNHTH